MTSKERISAVLNRQPVDRLPVDLWHTPEVAAMLRRHFGAADDLSLYKTMKLDKIVWDFIDYRTEEGKIAGGQPGALSEPGTSRTMWGVPIRSIQAGEAVYDEFGAPPLAGYETAASLDRYPLWPDPDRFEYDKAAALAERAAPDFPVIGPWVSCFEIYCQMRGLEQAMIDLAHDPELVDGILDYIENIQSEMMKRLFAKAGSLLTLVFISDDIGGQNGLLMSPRMWRRHLQPRLERWCRMIHSYGLKTFYHTDGGVGQLVGELIDSGVDVLNPIQHACPGMDMEALKRNHGSRVIFHGGVDNQTVLPRGTAAAVREETLRCLATLGAGKEGYICCSCHNVQPGTPLENILAMVQAVQEQ